MEPIDWYLSLVRHTTLVAFAKQEAGTFLLKRPSKNCVAPAPAGQMPFLTVAGVIDVDPLAGQWCVIRVKKREGNPYEDCISIGRASNCDLVLRVPFISKVQAHILRNPDGTYSLRGQSTSCPTTVNNRRVDANDVNQLSYGDQVGFGSMRLEFVDAGRLYTALSSELR